MQKDLDKIKATGTQVVAISYDSVDVLKKFADRQKITFPLLSDPDSKTITAFGILNKDVKKGRAAGVPYPGTFIVDKAGVVRAKLFLDGYRERHSNDALIKEAEKVK